MSLRRAINNKLNGPLALALFLGLGGCSLSPFDEDGGFRKVTTAIGSTGTLTEPKDFVKESRPQQQEYLPVGVTPPARSVDIRKGQGVKDFETDLQKQREQSLQKAAAPVPKSPYDGKIEPGFKPPPPPPLPTGAAPEIPLRGAQPDNQADAAAEDPKKSTARKPIEKKKRAVSQEADH